MKVTFIIPVFNAGTLLNEAVASITHSNFLGWEYEIILVDDCSTDEHTLLLLEQLTQQPRVRLIKQKRNGGPAKARNAGIMAATGDWISFLDADDYLTDDAIELRIAFIQVHPEVRWMAGDNVDVIAPRESIHPDLFEKLRNETQLAENIYQVKNATSKLLQIGATALLGTMFIKSDVIEMGRCFDTELTYGEDTNFFLELSLDYDLYWVAKPILHLRRYNDSMTKNKIRTARELARSSRALLFNQRFWPYFSELRWRHADILRRSAIIGFENNQYTLGISRISEAFITSPNDMRNFEALRTIFKFKIQKST